MQDNVYIKTEEVLYWYSPGGVHLAIDDVRQTPTFRVFEHYSKLDTYLSLWRECMIGIDENVNVFLHVP